MKNNIYCKYLVTLIPYYMCFKMWTSLPIKVSKNAGWALNSVDPNETAEYILQCFIWVFAVWPGLSVSICWVNIVFTLQNSVKHFKEHIRGQF